METWLYTLGAAFLVSGVASYMLSWYHGRWAVFDQPNQRSLHGAPVPRMGGVAIISGILFASIMTYQWNESGPLSSLLPVILGFTIVIIVSFLDDIYQTAAFMRLVGHLIASVLVTCSGLSVNTLTMPGWSMHLPVFAGIGLSILFILWITNLYNFMDGMDGFAAGMGVIGFGTFAVLGFLVGTREFAEVSASIAAACGGFLWLNFPPAKLFMGDVGAASLGFLAATLMLWANRMNIFPLWVGILVFSPFVMDATWTLFRRILAGKIPWHAHREHFYQRLVQLGWGHRRTVLSEYVLMLFCSILAVSLYLIKSTSVQLTGLGFIFFGYVALGLLIHGLEARHPQRET